jgi:predicted phosphodiesterase
MVNLTAISDTHDEHEKLEIEPTDILIHAGDATNKGYESLCDFLYWLAQQPACYKIYVPGNHDARAFKKNTNAIAATCKRIGIQLLMDSPLYLKYWDLTIWGSHFFGTYRTPKHYKLGSCDLLVTHEPAYGFADQVYRPPKENEDKYGHIGSKILLEQIRLIRPKIHICGHIHEQAGVLLHQDIITINACSKDSAGHLINQPIKFTMENI